MVVNEFSSAEATCPWPLDTNSYDPGADLNRRPSLYRGTPPSVGLSIGGSYRQHQAALMQWTQATARRLPPASLCGAPSRSSQFTEGIWRPDNESQPLTVTGSALTHRTRLLSYSLAIRILRKATRPALAVSPGDGGWIWIPT